MKRTKKNITSGTKLKGKQQQRQEKEEEEITSESSEEQIVEENTNKKRKIDTEEDKSEKNGLNSDELRAQLARTYLEKLDAIHREEDESASDDDRIGHHLEREAVESKRAIKGFKAVADKIAALNLVPTFKKGHQLPVTCLAVSTDGLSLFSGSKDCCVIQWDIPSLKIVHTFKGHRKEATQGHKGHVFSVAVSSNKRYLATGGKDHCINVYDLTDHSLAKTFFGHKDSVTALTFRHASDDLYSGSADRSVKIWDCQSLSYVDTLYGHELPITGIDSQFHERCITSSEDCTVRLWKIGEGTQLVFRAEKLNLDCTSYLSEEKWVTGSQQGTVNLWTSVKKKPLFEIANAHGVQGISPNWITAISAMKYTDLIASGSNNGVVKLWKVTHENKLEHIKDIPVLGWVNALQFTSNGQYLIIGVGQEPKYGRWSCIKQAKNGIYLVPLKF